MNEAAESSEEELLLWGGLYVAFANGRFHAAERDQLAVVVGEERVEAALEEGEPSVEECLARFRQCAAALGRRIPALELYRLLYGLLEVVASDGEIERTEIDAFEVLAKELGLCVEASDMVIGNFLIEMLNRVTIKLEPTSKR